MIFRSALCCAAVLALTTQGWAAEKAPPKKVAKSATKAAAKPVAKTASKAAAKPAAKASSKAAPKGLQKAAASPRAKAASAGIVTTSLNPSPAAAVATPALRGRTEVLTCREGTEDRHARIAVVLIGGKTDSFAYYSKWKPRTCSIYLQRNRDAFSKWSDSGSVTNVNTDRGAFQIEHKTGEYRIVFRDVDRERYCGMDGTINGSLTIRKGRESCELAGIMEEGIPLGQAYAHLEQGAAAQAQGASADEAVRTDTASTSHLSPFQRIAQWFRSHRVPPRPEAVAPTFRPGGGVVESAAPASAAVGVSD